MHVCYSPVLSVSSKNGTLPRIKPTTPTSPLAPPISPTSSNADTQLDFLFKSLAKESLSGIAKDDRRNENPIVEGKMCNSKNHIFMWKFVDSESECSAKSLPAGIPNNISKKSAIVKPLPPGQIKCNILKGMC